jgi:hypothetical protein
MYGILSSSVHVGNSDVVGEFVYEDSDQLVDTISNKKHLDGVSKVLWSEEVSSVPVNAENVLRPFKKMWNHGNNRKKSMAQIPEGIIRIITTTFSLLVTCQDIVKLKDIYYSNSIEE